MSDNAESSEEENGNGVSDNEGDLVEQNKVEEETVEVTWNDLVNHVCFCFIFFYIDMFYYFRVW